MRRFLVLVAILALAAGMFISPGMDVNAAGKEGHPLCGWTDHRQVQG